MKPISEYREAWTQEQIRRAREEAEKTSDQVILANYLDSLILPRAAWLREVGTYSKGGSAYGPWESWTVAFQGRQLTYWERFHSPLYEAYFEVSGERHTFDPRGRPYNQIHELGEAAIQKLLAAIDLMEMIPVLQVD